MEEYFLLQHKILNRKLIDFGVPIWVGYILSPIVFVVLSSFLFYKTEFAGYIYVFIALGLISKLSEPKRNDFLKAIFSKCDYLKIRLFENWIIGVPFIIFLIYKESYLFALILVVLSAIVGLFNFNINTNFTIPTPFGKYPFEFAVGFRKTFFIFPIAYFLTFMSIYADNFNLGVFSLLLVALVSLLYYSEPENQYFIWTFKSSSKGFLLKKIIIGSLYLSYLSFPIIIVLSVFFYENLFVLMVFFMLCLVYLTTIILAKYSAYPNEMNLPQGMLVVISLIFPPILILVIPFLYYKSIINLKPILDD